MDLTGMISTGFSIVFIITLYSFIFRVLRLMKQDLNKQSAWPMSQGAPDWGLEIVENGANAHLQKGAVIPLRSGLSLGRKADNTIVLQDPYVSYYHLRFFLRDGRYVIEDLNSTNGTMLNHDRLEHKTYLKVNDIITLGSTVFRVIN